MSQSRYFNAFLLSSLTFFLLYFIFLSFSDVKKILKPAPSKVIKVSIITPPKKVAVIKTPEPIVQKIEKVEPTPQVVLPKPTPKKIIKKIKPKKIVKKKKVLKKKIVKKKKVIKKKIVKKKIIKKIVIKKPIKKHVPVITPVYHVPKAVIKPIVKPTPTVAPKAKNNYHKKAFLRNVRSKIIANKKYPKIAKRRHIEGSVKVRFDIDKRGQVCNIRFINGKRIFQKSIKRTLEKTFPMGIPAKVKSELPIVDISVVLHFNIR